MKCIKTFTMIAMLTAVCANANAALITWGSAQNTTTSAANDIVNGGAVVLALNGHNFADGNAGVPADVTLGGVLFSVPSSSVFLGKAFNDPTTLDGNTTGDADYDTLLNNVAVADGAALGNGSTNTSANYQITGLSLGTDYYIQAWYTDLRSATSSRIMILDGATSIHASLGGWGQNAVGTFTADDANQMINVSTTTAGRSHLTAIVVREVPEPASMLLLGLGSLAMLKRKK